MVARDKVESKGEFINGQRFLSGVMKCSGITGDGDIIVNLIHCESKSSKEDFVYANYISIIKS